MWQPDDPGWRDERDHPDAWFSPSQGYIVRSLRRGPDDPPPLVRVRDSHVVRELPSDAIQLVPQQEDDMQRVQAWGRVRKTKGDAIDDAVNALGRLAAELRKTQVGYPRYDEVRPTPTGYQARVSATMRPRWES